MCYSQVETVIVQEEISLNSSNRNLGYIEGEIFGVKGVKYWNGYKEKLPYLFFWRFLQIV